MLESASSISTSGSDEGLYKVEKSPSLLSRHGLVPVHLTYKEQCKEFYENISEADDKLRVPENKRIQVEWSNLTYRVVDRAKQPSFFQRMKGAKAPKKTLLDGVSGYCSPGSMLAIIGPSGAGKTSMLLALAKKLEVSHGAKLTGTVSFNGNLCTSSELRGISGFVMQEDNIMGSMTPLELLRFTSVLNLPASVSEEEREERVQLLLTTMGLQKCKDNFIGSSGLFSHVSGIKRGLSGGERKRVSICIELVNNPTMLFCDEPTSGLDSFASKVVVEKLQTLAFLGKTIISTIHQPSSEIFRLFNRLMLLVDGRTVYFGDTEAATKYFAKLGYKCPKFINPADFLMKVVQVAPENILGEGSDPMSEQEGEAGDSLVAFPQDSVGLRNATRDQVEKLKDQFASSKQYKDAIAPPPPPTKNVEMEAKKGYNASYLTQFVWLTWRSALNTVREPALCKVRIAVSVIMGLLSGLVFLQTDDTAAGIGDRVASTFFVLLSQMFGAINGPTFLFPSERGAFFRDRMSNMYSTILYYWAKILTDLPISIIAPLLTGVIAYYMIGYKDGVVSMFEFSLMLILMTLCCFALGMVLSCAILDPGLVTRIQPLFTLPLILFCGFFVNLDSIGSWLSWIQYISFVKYSFRYAINVILSDTYLHCNYDEFKEIVPYMVDVVWQNETTAMQVHNISEPAYVCPVSTGDAYLEKIGMKSDNLWLDVLWMGLFIVGIHTIACAFLVFRSP